jgi:hypothetical protein
MGIPYAAAGAKVHICSTVQFAEPADAAAYAALSFTEIGDVQSIGEYGDEARILTADTLQDNRTFKAKGTRDAGTVPLICLDRPDDTGQQALNTAEAANAGMYAFKVTLPNKLSSGGTDQIDYFCALVSSKRLNVGDTNNIVKRGWNLAINTKITTTAAT